MEALIHHFKLVTEGFRVPPGELITRSSPREASSAVTSSPTARQSLRGSISAIRRFVNLQALRDMCFDGYVADLITNLAMLDPILGGIDR